jgi:CRP/FNR family transcriptional regulator, cyclic AMP receptor protein
VKLDERTSALGHAPLFSGLTSAALFEIARSASTHVLTTGGSLPVQAPRLASLFLIESGSVHLSLVSAGGHEFVITVAGRGEILGELVEPGGSGSSRAHPTLVAIARESTRVLRIPWHTLRRAIASSDLAQRCNVLLAERTAWMLEVIEDLALHPLDARLARLLTRLQARSASHPAMRLHRFDQGTLSLMAHATRPKVNQHLQRLQRLGAIDLDRGSVRVRNRALLAQFGRRE